MKRNTSTWCAVALLIALTAAAAYSRNGSTPPIIDHTCTELSEILDEWIDSVQANGRVYYVHTSHGEQLTVGLQRIEDADYKYSVAIGNNYLPAEAGAFCIYDKEGAPRRYWYGDEWMHGMDTTRRVVNDNPTTDVSMFVWCEELYWQGTDYAQAYLDSIGVLESEFPNVTFVYTTCHAQFEGDYAYTRHLNNELIREYCMNNNKILYDFADLDSWWFNPATQEWEQNSCQAQGHTVPLQHPHFNGNDAGHTTYESCEQKGKAVWWMMARIAGWQDSVIAGDFIRSDADANSSVMLDDAIYILQYKFAGGDPPLCMDAADANDDGSVLMGDAIYILQYKFVGGTPPPAPFLECGPDPTSDGIGCSAHSCETGE